jgi:flagellar FliJ protein
MSFHFRLAPLLRLRESIRDERRAALAEAYRALDILNDRQRELKQEIAALARDYRRSSAPGSLDVDRLLRRHRHELSLRSGEKELARQNGLIVEEIERRREALVAADRDVRVLEKLRERQAERHTQDEAKRDLKQLDEIASRAHYQRRAAAEEALWAG